MFSMKESEIPKFLAEELSSEPYNLKLNLISFTSLQGDALMRVFQMVLIDIQPSLKDVLEEATNVAEKVNAMMELLRILKFWPKCFNQHVLKTALESVNQEVIWDTMGWMLTRKDELRKRAYLAKFLVKVAVPEEFMIDPDMAKVWEEYTQTLEEFKNVHKKLESSQKQKGISELVTDLKSVEREIDSCSRKLDMMKTKVAGLPGIPEHLSLAAGLRKARNDKNRLRTQSFGEERKLCCLEKKAFILSNKAHEIQDLNSNTGPEGLLERIEQDCEILKFICHTKIPQDIEISSRKVHALQQVLEQPPDNAADLNIIREKILGVQTDIHSLEETMRNSDTDPRLMFARQKAAENKRKKVELLEEVEELRKDMLDAQNQLREKREMRKQMFPDGIPCLSSRDYKEYVKTMRVKAAKYKTMRAEISAVQQEIGIMSTTKFLVEESLKESVNELKKLEEKLGIVGFSGIQERVEQNRSRDDESKMRYIYEQSEKWREMAEKVKAKKQDYEVVYKEVVAVRQQVKALELDKNRLEKNWEMEMGPIQESNKRFETRILKLTQEMGRCQEDMCRKIAELPVMKANLQRAVAEQVLLKQNPSNGSAFKNKMLTRIVDQERLQKSLNQQMSQLEQAQAYDKKQRELWENLKKILELKKQIVSGAPSTAEIQYD